MGPTLLEGSTARGRRRAPRCASQWGGNGQEGRPAEGEQKRGRTPGVGWGRLASGRIWPRCCHSRAQHARTPCRQWAKGGRHARGGRASPPPATKPKCNAGGGQGQYEFAPPNKAHSSARKAADDEKEGPDFFGSGRRPPSPPPQMHPGRRAGLEVTPRDKAGGRPKRFYASWHGANGAAGPRQHHGGPTATLQPPLPAARKRRPRCRAGRPPEARIGPAYPSRVYHQTHAVPLKGGHARRVPWGRAHRRAAVRPCPRPAPLPASCALPPRGPPPRGRE